MEDTINKLENLIIKNDDYIHIDSTPEETIAMMEIILTGMIEDLEHEDYEEATICLDEIYEILQNKRTKISKDSNDFLCILQLDHDYNSLCRIFRYFYGEGIYTDKDYRIAMTKIIKYIRTNKNLKNEYDDSLQYALSFFNVDTSVNPYHIMRLKSLMGDISVPSDFKIESDLQNLYYDAIDYLDFSIEILEE